MMPLPDFYIIGAMKCGTTTLATQLSKQNGVFMCTPKEPNFFSDDDIFAQGIAWYKSLFDGACADDLKGEASTHYTKLPTLPKTSVRLHAVTPAAKFIYLIRHPVDRLVSHYVHDWTMGVIRCGIEDAITRHPELVDYGRYAMQLRPYVELFGPERILVIRLEDLEQSPKPTFLRIGAFLGRPNSFQWHTEIGPQNVSRERVRRFPLSNLIINHPLATHLRRRLVPKTIRHAVKSRLQMRERPALSPLTLAHLGNVFASDLSGWPLGLDCSHAYEFAG